MIVRRARHVHIRCNVFENRNMSQSVFKVSVVHCSKVNTILPGCHPPASLCLAKACQSGNAQVHCLHHHQQMRPKLKLLSCHTSGPHSQLAYAQTHYCHHGFPVSQHSAGSLHLAKLQNTVQLPHTGDFASILPHEDTVLPIQSFCCKSVGQHNELQWPDAWALSCLLNAVEVHKLQCDFVDEASVLLREDPAHHWLQGLECVYWCWEQGNASSPKALHCSLLSSNQLSTTGYEEVGPTMENVQQGMRSTSA